MLNPNKRLAVAVGASLLAATLIMFWTLHRALSNIQAFA